MHCSLPVFTHGEQFHRFNMLPFEKEVLIYIIVVTYYSILQSVSLLSSTIIMSNRADQTPKCIVMQVQGI